MSDPQTPGNDDLEFGDDDTQEIPVVDGPDYGADSQAYRPDPFHPDAFSATAHRPVPNESSSGYTVLPSDAFAPKTTRKNRRYALIAAACVVVLGVIVGGAVLLFGGSDDSGITEASPSGSSTTQADEVCPAGVDGNVTTGRDAGGTDSSADVIKAFNYAYYVKRDARAVSEFVQPAARPAVIPSLEKLQEAIDDLPRDIVHCLTITDLGGDLNRVQLAQFDPRPGGDRTTFHQQIQTTYENGRWWIVSNMAVD